MDDLLGDMRLCKSVRACIDLALTDAYGEDEEAVDVKAVWSEVKEIEKDREAIDKKVEGYLKELKY